MGAMSIWHWLIVLVIILLVFGTKKLRNIGQDLGGAVKGFKDGMKDGTAEKSDAQQQIAAGADKEKGQTIDGEVKEKTRS